jgi:hypothetical protein
MNKQVILITDASSVSKDLRQGLLRLPQAGPVIMDKARSGNGRKKGV